MRNSSGTLPPSTFWECSRLKAGGEDLVLGGIGKQVPGDLLGDELVVGKVLLKSPDDPVAPRPDIAVAVLLVTIGVGIAGDVQPLGGHSFGVFIANSEGGPLPFSKAPFKVSLICKRRRVRSRGRRQSGQVEGYPAQPSCFIGFETRIEFGSSELSGNKMINFVSRSWVLALGNFSFGGQRLKRPMCLILSSFLNPLVEKLFFLLRERKLWPWEEA